MLCLLPKAGVPLSPEIVTAFVNEQDELHKAVKAQLEELIAGKSVSVNHTFTDVYSRIYFNTSAGPGLTPDIMENLREEGEKKYQAVRHKVLDLMNGHHPVISCYSAIIKICTVLFLALISNGLLMMKTAILEFA